MSEFKMISPLLDGIELKEKISDRGRSECYACVRTQTGEQLVLKHISIPESDTKTQALILTGAAADEQAANEYYRTLADDLRRELELMAMLSDKTGVRAWEDFQVEPREGVGFDVYALMPRKVSLRSYLQDNAMTQLQALNLGLDLCDSMGSLNADGYAYLNLKPENVFVDARKRFSIGDLGLTSLEGLAFAAVPEEQISDFSAPEVAKLIPEPSETSDQYSLGMLLFYVFNGNRLPFEDEKVSTQRAQEKRLSSEILPSPQYADYELAEIISKACSHDPEKRYSSFAELKQALTLYMQRNEVSDQLLVPPLPVQPAQEESEDLPGKEPEPVEVSEDVQEPERPVESPETEGASEAQAEPVEESEPIEEPEDEPGSEVAAGAEPEEVPEEEPEEAPGDDAVIEPEEISEESAAVPASPEEALETALAGIAGKAGEDVPEEASSGTQTGEEVIDLSGLGALEAAEEEQPQSIEELLASVNHVLSEEEEQEAEVLAPDLEANEAAVKAVNETEPQKRKKKKWVPILIGLLVLALLGAALAYFYSNWYLVKMDGLDVTERTADSITVAYNLSSPDPGLSWDCIDTYGNAYSGTAGEGTVLFRGLEPGTQYTVRFFPGQLHKLTGETSISASTANATQIVSMTAVQAAVNTTAQITLVVSGPEPDQWLLTYSSSGSDSGSVKFSGHSAEIPNLQLHDTYTFELTSPDDVYLSGQTSCEMTVNADVQAKDLQVAYATDNSLTVTWQNLGDPPLSWSARCVGEGYDQTVEVSECAATFEGIRLDTAYTFSVTAEGLEVPLSVSLPANARIVTAFDVEPTDEGTIQVKWACSDPQPEGGWIVRYQIGQDPNLSGSFSIPDQNEVVLTAMPANAEIVVSLEAKDGQSMIGVSTLSTQTPEPAEYAAHAFQAQDSELQMYHLPDAVEWTLNDLTDSDDSFDPGTVIAAVLIGPEEFDTEETDDEKEPSATTVTFVVRGEQGQVISYSSESSAWKDLWTDGKYMMRYTLPKAPGTYQLELYFDGKYVNRKVFTIEGDTEQSTEEEG